MDGNEFVLGNLGKVIYIGDEGDVCYVFLLEVRRFYVVEDMSECQVQVETFGSFPDDERPELVPSGI